MFLTGWRRAELGSGREEPTQQNLKEGRVTRVKTTSWGERERTPVSLISLTDLKVVTCPPLYQKPLDFVSSHLCSLDKRRDKKTPVQFPGHLPKRKPYNSKVIALKLLPDVPRSDLLFLLP